MGIPLKKKFYKKYLKKLTRIKNLLKNDVLLGCFK